MKEGDGVILFLFEEKENYVYTGDKEWKRDTGLINSRFILCKKGRLSEVIQKEKRDEWQRIFASSIIEVWERESYYKEKKYPVPLRLGLEYGEKKIVTNEVRRMIGDVLNGKEPHISSQFPDYFNEKQDLDVALWVDGKIRASVIMTGKSFREALEIGASRATQDMRFAPITLEELPSARIEITLMSDLVLPLTFEEYRRNEIDPTKGYRISSDKKVGWYLPEVHNVVSFSHLQGFLLRLTVEKAKIHTPPEIEEYGQFETVDWIETEGDLLSLSGPTPALSDSKVTDETIASVAERAAKWLLSIQRTDGSFPHIITEKGEERDRENLTATGCTAHVLALYGKKVSDTAAEEAAHKAYNFLGSNLPSKDEQDVFSLLAWVYYLRLSLVLGEKAEREMIEHVLFGKKFFQESPIYWLQTLSLLGEYTRAYGKEFLSLLEEETKEAYTVFRKGREQAEMQLALYPELVATFSILYEITASEIWRQWALEVGEWYSKKQLENGSFPHSPLRTFAYTRGTGKIFEVLACFPEENKESITRAFRWLQSMQYQKENLFWVESEKTKVLVGAFRHDTFKREAWIDGAAHVILGCTRLLP